MSDNKMRLKFEKWCKSTGTKPLRLRGTDQYIVEAVQSAWLGYQAALAQQASEIETLKAREQWIHDNASIKGAGRGFTVMFFVPVDHEDIFCGIDAAIANEQAK